MSTHARAQDEKTSAGELFSKLRYLGLRNCEMADEVARAVAHAPIMERIRILDLLLGILGDEGARH